MGGRRPRRAPEDPDLLRALPSQQLTGPEDALGGRVHQGAQEVQEGLSGHQADLALERGQPLPARDRRKRPGPADLQLAQARRAVLHGRAQGVQGLGTIVGIDILDEQNVNRTIKFLKSFLRYASPDPKVIGFHNYSDTNRFSTTPDQARAGHLPRQGVADRDRRHRQAGHVLPGQRVARREGAGLHVHAGQVELAHQRAVLLPVQPGAGSRRPRRFDAGLINPDGSPRPGYDVVKSRKARSCHK